MRTGQKYIPYKKVYAPVSLKLCYFLRRNITCYISIVIVHGMHPFMIFEWYEKLEFLTNLLVQVCDSFLNQGAVKSCIHLWFHFNKWPAFSSKLAHSHRIITEIIFWAYHFVGSYEDSGWENCPRMRTSSYEDSG